MAFAARLRATGQVLRDQFVFMLRAGFDAFEEKESDAEAFAPRQARFRVFLSTDRRGRIHGASPAHASCVIRESAEQ